MAHLCASPPGFVLQARMQSMLLSCPHTFSSLKPCVSAFCHSTATSCVSCCSCMFLLLTTITRHQQEQSAFEATQIDPWKWRFWVQCTDLPIRHTRCRHPGQQELCYAYWCQHEDDIHCDGDCMEASNALPHAELLAVGTNECPMSVLQKVYGNR